MNVDVVATVPADGQPRLEHDIFGSADPRRIICSVDRFCRDQLGASTCRYELFSTSVGSCTPLGASHTTRGSTSRRPPKAPPGSMRLAARATADWSIPHRNDGVLRAVRALRQPDRKNRDPSRYVSCAGA
ncbi:MAG TPA: hypothetical protein VNT03_15990 [Baekduia sp.]|nr:hypothetical protein [Baekduia sp.]